MSSVVYSLKNGINRTNNPTTGGVFAYGSYTSAGAFTLFTDYEYEDGTAFVSEPFDDTQPLVWKGSSQYPHLGFENLTPNSSITPQPFPSFGIYLHPFIESGVRKDVGVRVTIPFGGSIAISSIIQRADTSCGDDIGYRIMKNGVAIQSRQFIQPSTTPTTINTPANTFVAGDIIDFIVDTGSQDNSFCDDTALEVTLTYLYTKIPDPTITTTPILCSTTVINGTTAFVSEGTFASIYDGTTRLYSTGVVLNPVLLNGTFSFTGLDLANSLGKKLSVILEKTGDVNSNPIDFIVQDGGCIVFSLQPPVVTSIDVCDFKCDYQRTMTGVAGKQGDIAIFKHPYNVGDPVIAVGINTNGTWEIKSSSFKDGEKYIAYLISYYSPDPNEGELEETDDLLSISNITCDPNCELVGRIKGSANGITNGIIRLFTYPLSTIIRPTAVGIIRNGKFEIITTSLAANTNYILSATKFD